VNEELDHLRFNQREDHIPQWASRILIGIAITIVLAWAAWVTTTIIGNSMQIAILKTTVDRLPVMEGKIDALIMARGIQMPVPDPNPTQKQKQDRQ
jgi:hypothetical protein